MLKGEHTAIFKCHEIEHKGKSRYQAVPLLQSDGSTTVVGGLRDRCRYIIRRSGGLFTHNVHADSQLLAFHLMLMYSSGMVFSIRHVYFFVVTFTVALNSIY